MVAPYSRYMDKAPALARLIMAVLAMLIVSACAGGDSAGGRSAGSGRQDAALKQLPPHHIAQKGDTVYSIARRYGIPADSIVAANNLQPPYTLFVGQRLVLPTPRFHIVKPGDTLYEIAHYYGLELSSLTAANRIGPPYTIYPNQEIVLPSLRAAARGSAASNLGPSVGAGLSPPPEGGSTGGGQSSPSESDTVGRAVSRSTALPDAARPPPLAGSGFQWPLRGRIISSFGATADGLHNDGINIAAPRGTPVAAAENGTVIYAGEEIEGFGRMLLIKHADGWTTAYAHNEILLVRRGDRVKRGQTVARVGSSGNVDSPQLHFEIRRRAKAVDPLRHIAANRTIGELSPNVFLAALPNPE